MQLFTQSAQREQAAFVVDEANVAAVLQICRLVQGMPLGLELAAAWVGTLSLPEIADAITQSNDFLTSGWRDIPNGNRVYARSLNGRALAHPAGATSAAPTCRVSGGLAPAPPKSSPALPFPS